MKFTHVEWRNFLSYGNGSSQLDLDTNQLTVLTGKNGHGKSAVLEAIYYALTGKPYRKVKKGQLVNQINKKNCEIRLRFEQGGNDYCIVRGISPDVFEIYKDGTLVDQDSSIRDYQSVIQNLVGLDEKTIKNTMILSSRFYTPFLEMSAAEKRNFVENLLSIQIFSEMADEIKQRASALKTEKMMLEKDKERYESNIATWQEALEKTAGDVMSDVEYDQRHDEISAHIEKIQAVLESTRKKLDAVDGKMDKLNAELRGKENELAAMRSEYSAQAKALKSELEFYREHDYCPTCSQVLVDKETAVATANEKLVELKEKFSPAGKKLAEEIDALKEKPSALKTKKQELSDKILDLTSKQSTADYKLKALREEYERASNAATEASEKISELEGAVASTEEKIHAATSKQDLYKQCLDIVSDKGIKRYILNKYVPVLNSLIADFLSLMEAEYIIEFDESLTEKIIARGYDKLSYGNFSAGEKQRVDLALLFAFVEIGRMRNTVGSNIMILDEVLDASLDEEGIRGVMRILSRFMENGMSVFVISHRNGVDKYFDCAYNVHKKQFSEIEETV